MPCSAEIEPPKRSDGVVHGLGHRLPQRQVCGFVHAGGLRDVVVHVAVAEVPEHDRPRAGAYAFDGLRRRAR